VLRTKHLMKPEVLAMARKLVATVVRQLLDRLATEARVAFGGVRDRRRPSLRKLAKNLDMTRTLRASLGRYAPSEKKLYLDRPRFFSRTRPHAEAWQVVLVVDQSGSMLSSVIHSAVTAACLWGVPGLKTHLVAFDTQVVDLTRDVSDPVELLLGVQLGGGTDIARAMTYAASLVEAPRRAMVVLITDFYEGGSPNELVRIVRSLAEQGTKVLGLASLARDATPRYDRDVASALVEAGAHVGAMTPGELATWIAEKVRG
jgi:Mg-chelatase subunit ChlD